MPDDTRTALRVGEVGILREEMLDGRVRLVRVGARPVRGGDVSLALSRTSDFLSDRNERHGGLGRHHLRSEHERGFKGRHHEHPPRSTSDIGRSIASQLQSRAGITSVLQFQ